MNAKVKIPDRTKGGTFIYDKDGTFVEHIPPTQPREPKAGEASDSAAAQSPTSAAKKGSK